MLDDHGPAYIDHLLQKRWIVAGERSQEGVRDNGVHSHHAGELLGSYAGLLSISTQSGNWVVPATHCFWVPPREVHAVRSFGPFSGWGVFVAERACTDLPSNPRTMRTGGLLREAVRRLASLPLVEPSPRRERLGGVIVDEINELPSEELGLAMPSDPRLLKIAQAIAKDPAVDRDLAAWALWGGVSTRTLSRRFVAETGFTFSAWRQRARLLRALELLAAGQPVTTVSLDLGYDSIGTFIALFRRTFGMTPSVYAKSTRP